MRAKIHNRFLSWFKRNFEIMRLHDGNNDMRVSYDEFKEYLELAYNAGFESAKREIK